MAKGKKKAITKENSKEQKSTLEEIKDINIMNLYNVSKLLMFDVETSIKNKEFTTYNIEDSELAHPLNTTFISEQYENMVLMPEFFDLYTGNIGKFRFCIVGLIPLIDKLGYMPKEEQLATNKKVNEFLSEIKETIDYVLKNNEKEQIFKDEAEFCKELLNFLVAKATEKNLTSILELSCKEIFSLYQGNDNRYIFVRRLTYSNYDKVTNNLLNELKAHKCVADESINIIGYLLFTPPHFLLINESKDKADIKSTRYSIQVVQNFNHFLWKNCNDEEEMYYFREDYGRYRYCLQILIDKIADYYSEIPVDKLDEILGMHEKIYNILSEIDDVLGNFEPEYLKPELYSINQLSIFVCSLLSKYDFLEHNVLDLVEWCDSPYTDWESNYGTRYQYLQ